YDTSAGGGRGLLHALESIDDDDLCLAVQAPGPLVPKKRCECLSERVTVELIKRLPSPPLIRSLRRHFIHVSRRLIGIVFVCAHRCIVSVFRHVLAVAESLDTFDEVCRLAVKLYRDQQPRSL